MNEKNDDPADIAVDAIKVSCRFMEECGAAIVDGQVVCSVCGPKVQNRDLVFWGDTNPCAKVS